MNLTVVSEGVQFDRLAIMYLGDTEVWRTSTAEPKAYPGISWSYWKDMTNYISLWKIKQKLIFDLGNIVDSHYTGAFNVTLRATFFSTTIAGKDDKLDPAELIVPISAKRGGQGQSSAFNYPGDVAATNITIPRNVIRAMVSISATGQGNEEFWQTNVPDSILDKTPGYFGMSAYREARLFIDGQLAGLTWPFPVVFTGGISPPLHRPMVGIQAFDLLENEIDITPWLGVLCDGEPHTFSIEIVGENSERPNSNWVVTGKVFSWLDDNNDRYTKGPAPTAKISPTTLDADGEEYQGQVWYTQGMVRTLKLTADLEIKGKKETYGWTQRYSMHNNGNISNSGNDQYVNAIYEGESTATRGWLPYFYAGFRYPFEMNFTATNESQSVKMSADLTQGMDLTVTGKAAFSYGVDAFANRLESPVSGSVLTTSRHSTATFYQNNDGSTTSGESESHQVYKFGGRSPRDRTGQRFNPAPLLYSRDVHVVGNKRVQDDVFVYHSDYKARPEKLTVSKFVEEFAPVPNPDKPGMAKFVGKNEAQVEGASKQAVLWNV